MAYDEFLAKRIRNALTPYQQHLQEKKMMGGLCFMYKGKMACGIMKESLMIRVMREQYESLLQKPHCRVMDFTGRILKGFLYVDKEGIQTETQLKSWLELGIEFVNQQGSDSRTNNKVKTTLNKK